ncbi:uncharacterized protein [Dysidea avara]|uniref:uncharacterized protein n=1 Tax=Dysidea avara TaxID=196820 RepID=UPI003321B6B6
MGVKFLFKETTVALKNLIAALYSSRCDGSNKFEKDGILFGWKPIEDMLHKEVQRKNYQLPRVSGLKENFVYRDPWTRLNVNPAKQDYVCHIRIGGACIWVATIR